MLRDAYGTQGEQVAEELTVPLDVKVAVWTADLAMLEAVEDAGPDLAGLNRASRRMRSRLWRAIGRALLEA